MYMMIFGWCTLVQLLGKWLVGWQRIETKVINTLRASLMSQQQWTRGWSGSDKGSSMLPCSHPLIASQSLMHGARDCTLFTNAYPPFQSVCSPMSCCFFLGSDIGGGVSSPCGIFRSSVQAFATVPTTTATAVQAPAAGLLKSQQQCELTSTISSSLWSS